MKTIYIIQNHPFENAGTIIDYLTEKKYQFEVIHLYLDEPLPLMDDVSTIINLGCPTSITEYRTHEFLKKLYIFTSKIIRNKIPYLGICFGAQMLAHILGAKVAPNDVKEIGSYNVTLTDTGKNDLIFKGFPESFPVFHWHGDTFKIPDGNSLLGEGIDCKNQAFRSGNAVGIQFHLEVTPEEVESWCDIYVEELFETNKSQKEIIASAKEHAKNYKKLQYRFLDNFFENFS